MYKLSELLVRGYKILKERFITGSIPFINIVHKIQVVNTVKMTTDLLFIQQQHIHVNTTYTNSTSVV